MVRPLWHFASPLNLTEISTMRAETQVVVDEIKQAVSLLRRHL
jgi:hypothetical protein